MQGLQAVMSQPILDLTLDSPLTKKIKPVRHCLP